MNVMSANYYEHNDIGLYIQELKAIFYELRIKCLLISNKFK